MDNFQDSLRDFVDNINYTLNVREKAGVSLVVATLQLGRYLIEAKKIVPHGYWEQFVVNTTNYQRIRDAQRDMALYRVVSPYLDTLREHKIIDIDDSSFSSSHYVSISALWEFIGKDVPDDAIRVAINHIVNNATPLNISGAKAIIGALKTVDNIQDEGMRTLAMDLVEKHNVLNPAVLRNVDLLSEQAIEEIANTGHISVVIGDEIRSIPVDEIGQTELKLLAMHEETEAALIQVEEKRQYAISKNAEQWDYIDTIVGEPEKLIEYLKQYTQNGGIFKVSLMVKRDEAEFANG